MEQHSPSLTALAAAFFRAYHYAHDAPWIFEDPYAQQLLTASDTERLTTAYIDLLHYAAPALAAACPDRRSALRCALQHLGAPAETLSRARYAEDKLTEAVRHGVQQYVILGQDWIPLPSDAPICCPISTSLRSIIPRPRPSNGRGWPQRDSLPRQLSTLSPLISPRR